MKAPVMLAVMTVTMVQAVETIKIREMTIPKVYQSASGESLNYRIYLPSDYDKSKKYPLVLLLHGAGERGDNNKSQLVHGATDIVAYSINHNEPIIFVAPQCPKGEQWVNVPWGGASHTMPETPSDSMRLVIGLLDDLRGAYSIDSRRMYATGLSMGGYGTWDIIQRKPEMFAAAFVVCGGGDTGQAPKLIKMPILVAHGELDGVVKTHRARDMVAAIKEAGGKNIRYIEYKDVRHNVWKPTYSDEQNIKWLLGQQK